MAETFLSEFDFSGMQSELDQLFPSVDINLLTILRNIISGNQELNWNLIYEIILDLLKNEMGNLRLLFLTVLMLAIISALFTSISHLFVSNQIAQLSYYFVYLYLLVILLRTFYSCYTICQETINTVVTFIKLGIPIFALALSMTGKILTSSIFYEVAIIIIFLVEMMLLHMVIPFIYSYVLLSMINGLTEENRFDSLLRLLKKGIHWVLKGVIVIVAGINIVQTLITPVIDGVNVGTAKKLASLVPGIGTVSTQVADMVIGSAILIKNSIGIVFLIIFVLICMVPLLEIICITGVLRLSGAIMGMISDKRLVRCTEEASEASGMLFKTLMTAITMFLMTVAIVSYATSSV